MNPQLTRFTLYAVPAHVFLAPDARVPCPSALLLLLLAGWRALVRHVQQLFTAHAAAHCSAQLIAAHAAALVRYSRSCRCSAQLPGSCPLLYSAAWQLLTVLFSCSGPLHAQLLATLVSCSLLRAAARCSRSCSGPLLAQLLAALLSCSATAHCSAQLLIFV
jgi:hypothetical protein